MEIKKLIENNTSKKSIEILTEATKKNASDITQGDVFQKDDGYGMATFVAMGKLTQSRGYKNEFFIYSTILVPGKKGKTQYNVKGYETYVKFVIRYNRFSDVQYLGKWEALRKNYQSDDE